VKIYTAHLRAKRTPVLVKEGFSWGALLFGCLWLLAHRAWIPGALALAAQVLIGVLTGAGARVVLEIGLALLLGLIGRDLLRWSLARRGYTLAHVLAARDPDSALARLLTGRPDLAASYLPPEQAR
jgi:Protein of unknown function (DUF2628)